MIGSNQNVTEIPNKLSTALRGIQMSRSEISENGNSTISGASAASEEKLAARRGERGGVDST
jgi:hypothetical protein